MPPAPRNRQHEKLNGGIGLPIPPNANPHGLKLLIQGKQLWEKDRPRALGLLEEAYTLLNRPALAQVAKAHRRYPSLPTLDLRDYLPGDYHNLEDALREPEKVKRLTVVREHLKRLPNLSTLVNLEELLLYQNEIVEIPPSIVHCQKLRHLNLHNNQLTILPRFLQQLPNLRILRVGKNRIKKIEADPAFLSGLEEFSVGENRLSNSDKARLTAAGLSC